MRQNGTRSHHRLWVALFALLVLVAGITLLVDELPEVPAPPLSVLNRSLVAEPESLDPHKVRTKQAGDVLRDIGEGLTGFTESGELIPTGAERWEISDDGLSYRFYLRPDARWSNGDAVTAEHYVYSFRRLIDPSTAAFFAEVLIDLENAPAIVAGDSPVEALGVEATGEFELTLHLARRVPYFLSLLTNPAAYPVHPESVRKHGDAYARAGNLPSNGAYKLSQWVVGSVIELVRNDMYRGNANTAIDAVNHHVVTDGVAELNRYRAGELDITSNVPPEAFADVRRERPGELRVSPYLSVYFYGFNLTRPPFRDNVALRKALSMAIDREELVEKITGRGEQAAYGWVPPGVHDYEPREFFYASLDKEERESAAERMYNEAGFDRERPAEIELRYNTADVTQRIALAIQAMWRDVLGLEVKLINEEQQVLLSNIRAMQVTQVFRAAWTGDYNDANSFLYLFKSDSPSNLFGYRNVEFDALLEQAANQTDPTRRRFFLEEADRVLLADHPVIPIYFYVSKHLVSPRVRGWGDNVLDYHYSQYLSFADQP
jgi:ABC-type oligopeptide transport system substrate-binding subunit